MPRCLPVVFAALCFGIGATSAFAKLGGGIAEHIRLRLENVPPGQALFVDEDRIQELASLRHFYESRLFEPAWFGQAGLSIDARDLLHVLRGAAADGLRPDDYHLRTIERLCSLPSSTDRCAATDLGARADLDMLLTDAFLHYGMDAFYGRFNPVALDPRWRTERPEVHIIATLGRALANHDVGQSLRSLLPSAPAYLALRRALSRYRAYAAGGGWPTVPAGPALRPGDRGARVEDLRRRLAASGELPGADDGDGDYFGNALEQAVKHFQRRTGLLVDGIVGRETRASLNVSADDRVRQILANMERWRWLPRHWGTRYIRVNIAGFHLRVIDGGKSVLSMRVIVGRRYRQTPVFAGRMTYLVFNPYWEVPRKLAVQDILPLERKDPEYLERMGIDVLQGWGAKERIVDPATVDWDALSSRHFPYRFRQRPGPLNALGRIKFMFPNPFDVYLHDTPARALFGQPRRAFSSGCIRVAAPLKLADYLLGDDSGWTPAAIRAAIDSGGNRAVPLPRPIPIYILYWTAWVDGKGVTQFRDDLYGRDVRVERAMERHATESERRNAGSVHGGHV